MRLLDLTTHVRSSLSYYTLAPRGNVCQYGHRCDRFPSYCETSQQVWRSSPSFLSPPALCTGPSESVSIRNPWNSLAVCRPGFASARFGEKHLLNLDQQPPAFSLFLGTILHLAPKTPEVAFHVIRSGIGLAVSVKSLCVDG